MREPLICLRVDPANPGQFMACCGLLELTDRMWLGSEGWFDPLGTRFYVHPTAASAQADQRSIVNALAGCSLKNTMTDGELRRRDKLASMTKKALKQAGLESEKRVLDRRWREAPIVLGEPFNLQLDWFLDERAGGDAFKTWAGLQSVIEIALGIQQALRHELWSSIAAENWLIASAPVDGLPFNFDSDLGAVGSDRDIGFSLDPLKALDPAMKIKVRPMLEFLAFAGLQRFRPAAVPDPKRYRYSVWADPLLPEIAAAAACCQLTPAPAQVYEFRLLYRTKYLKSFLRANHLGGDNE
jgi:CRISPR-associated protein Csb3